MRLLMFIAASLLVLLIPQGWLAAQTTQPQDEVTTSPSPDVTPEARKLLDDIRAAYAALQSMELAGSYRLEVDAAGQQQDNQADFTASFLAPNRFRHELSNDAMIVSNGKQSYLFVARVNRFHEDETSPSRPPLAQLSEFISQVLRRQNPSLRAAVCEDAAEALLQESQSASIAAPARLDQTDYPVLRVICDRIEIDFLIDPRTHLIRQVRCDLSDDLVASGLHDVKRAMLTVDYTMVTPNAAVAEQVFAWQPPAGAIEARRTAAAVANDDPESLVGKPAPDFTLKDIEDKPVSLRELRGSVVVLDFWATWCGPCRVGLPHLEKLRAEFNDDGVRILAINLREEKDLVRKFLEETRLSLPVLFDTDGSVAEKYAVSGIPQTVVIGKNGAIRNVLVGLAPDGEQTLRKAIQEAIESN